MSIIAPNKPDPVFYDLFGREVDILGFAQNLIPSFGSVYWLYSDEISTLFYNSMMPNLLWQVHMYRRHALLFNYRDIRVINIGKDVWIGEDRAMDTSYMTPNRVLFNYLEAIWEEYADYRRKHEY